MVPEKLLLARCFYFIVNILHAAARYTSLVDNIDKFIYNSRHLCNDSELDTLLSIKGEVLRIANVCKEKPKELCSIIKQGRDVTEKIEAFFTDMSKGADESYGVKRPRFFDLNSTHPPPYRTHRKIEEEVHIAPRGKYTESKSTRGCSRRKKADPAAVRLSPFPPHNISKTHKLQDSVPGVFDDTSLSTPLYDTTECYEVKPITTERLKLLSDYVDEQMALIE